MHAIIYVLFNFWCHIFSKKELEQKEEKEEIKRTLNIAKKEIQRMKRKIEIKNEKGHAAPPRPPQVWTSPEGAEQCPDKQSDRRGPCVRPKLGAKFFLAFYIATRPPKPQNLPSLSTLPPLPQASSSSTNRITHLLQPHKPSAPGKVARRCIRMRRSASQRIRWSCWYQS